jgi:DNA-binding NarL/FixJ family response regulator
VGERPLDVVIAEDNLLVREGIRQLIDGEDGVRVVAAVAGKPELLEAVERLRPDAVMTDIRMPPTHRMEGIEAAHQIRARHPATGVVVLSEHADESYAFALLSDGTAGLAYLLKERVSERAELLRALAETAAGRSVLDPVIVDALVARRGRADGSPLRLLTERELAVLAQMAQGRNNQAIAERLYLSQSAIEKHIRAIFTKLGLTEDAQTNRRVSAVLTFLRDSR